MAIAWTMAMSMSFYFAWRHVDAKRHLVGALVAIALLWLIGIVLALLSRRDDRKNV